METLIEYECCYIPTMATCTRIVRIEYLRLQNSHITGNNNEFCDKLLKRWNNSAKGLWKYNLVRIYKG